MDEEDENTSLPWFRFYHEFAGDPAVQCLAFEDQRHFVMAMCLKRSGFLDRPMPSPDFRERAIAKALGLDAIAAGDAKRRLMDVALIDHTWTPLKWSKRQRKSDSSRQRVQKHRSKIKKEEEDTDTESNVTGNVTEPLHLEIENPEKSKTTEWMETFRREYPPRAGSQDWHNAQMAANARLKEGHKPEEFIAGAKRYAKYVEATGSRGTKYVKTAAAFLGPSKFFTEDWAPPAGSVRPDPYAGSV